MSPPNDLARAGGLDHPRVPAPCRGPAVAVVAAAPPSAQRLVRLIYADPKVPHAVAAEQLGLSVQRVRQIYPSSLYYFMVREAALGHDASTAAAALLAAQSDGSLSR